MHYLSILGCNFEKLLPDLKPASSTLLKCKPKMPYLDIHKLKFEKTIVIFEMSILQFLKIQISEYKYKCKIQIHAKRNKF